MERTIRLRDLVPECMDASDASAQPITDLSFDSRAVNEGTLFFCVPGERVDGKHFAREAANRGARAVVYDEQNMTEELRNQLLSLPVPSIAVPDVRLALSYAARVFFDSIDPSATYVGVTGTNGKTSVTWLLTHALAVIHGRAAFLGTLGKCALRYDGDEKRWITELATEADRTTDFPLTLHQFLANAKRLGCAQFVLEATSHALVQRRTDQIPWRAAAFTNLTRDHLDYHKTMEAYGYAKALLFERDLASSPAKDRAAIVNLDDAFGMELLELLRSRTDTEMRVLSFSRENQRDADVKVVEVSEELAGTDLELSIGGETIKTSTRLIGDYNVENTLAVIGLLFGLGVEPATIASLLPLLPAVPGRLERVGAGTINVFVDYAHTPDALEKAQLSLRALSKKRLITVFGCGGDRDRGKRPQMGRAVSELSDVAVVTSDNPRSEAPEAIIADILPGLASRAEIVVEPDRRSAIRRAVAAAGPGDIVLVAGKGHETYQEIAGTKHHFNDVEECLITLQQLSGAQGSSA